MDIHGNQWMAMDIYGFPWVRSGKLGYKNNKPTSPLSSDAVMQCEHSLRTRLDRVDVWAASCVIWEAGAGRPPWKVGSERHMESHTTKPSSDQITSAPQECEDLRTSRFELPRRPFRKQDCRGSVRVRFRFVPVVVQFEFRFAFSPSKLNKFR